MAAGQGVDVAHVRRWTAIGAGIAPAGVAAVAGPIGFVGLLAPHAVRKIVGPDARLVLPGSFLLGGALLAMCDALGAGPPAPLEVPSAPWTAVLGGPLFLALLARRRGQQPEGWTTNATRM
jgi:iron complex transport system permease protein